MGPGKAPEPTSVDSAAAAGRRLALGRQHDRRHHLGRRASGEGKGKGEQRSGNHDSEALPGHLTSPFFLNLESEDVGPPGTALTASGFEDVRLRSIRKLRLQPCHTSGLIRHQCTLFPLYVPDGTLRLF